MRYDNPCCRCGFCCLVESCGFARQFYLKLADDDVCPALYFEGETASCGLLEYISPEMLGIGVGCCIKARIFSRTGIVCDFSQLPASIKIQIVESYRNKKQVTVLKNPKKGGNYHV